MKIMNEGGSEVTRDEKKDFVIVIQHFIRRTGKLIKIIIKKLK